MQSSGLDTQFENGIRCTSKVDEIKYFLDRLSQLHTDDDAEWNQYHTDCTKMISYWESDGDFHPVDDGINWADVFSYVDGASVNTDKTTRIQK